MIRELRDEEIRHASSIVLTDDKRPGWGMTIPVPMPFSPEPELPRQPLVVNVNSGDAAAIERWRRRVVGLQRK